MSAYVPKHRGKSFKVDKWFGPVGRIALSLSTDDVGLAAARERMLADLYRHGYLDILRSIRDRKRGFSVAEVFEAWSHNRLRSLTEDAKLDLRFWPAAWEWVPQSARAKSSSARYRTSLKSLERVKVVSARARISDLARVDWIGLSNSWKASGSDWNRLRSTVSRFLSVTLGKHHPLRREIVDLIPKLPERERVPDLDLETFWQIVNATPEHVRASWVCLLLTGMRVGEYLACREEDLLPISKSLKVPGTKTKASQSVLRIGEPAWQWVRRAVPAPVGYKQLYRYWREGLVLRSVLLGQEYTI